MKIRAKNTDVSPVYWAHLRKWPHGQVVEYDVSNEEYEAICADSRINVESVVGDLSEVDINRVLVEDGIVGSEEKRGPGRPKKAR